MKKYYKGTLVLSAFAIAPLVSAYEFTVQSEVYFDSGPIIKVIEYGENDDIGVWLYEDETLVLRSTEGEIIARCDSIIPEDELFGEYGGNAVNIEGTTVQYVGIDGQGLIGWTVDCLSKESTVIGDYVPTFSQPDGDYDIGYDGRNTNMYLRDGSVTTLHPLADRIFYYSGNDAGDLLAGFRSTLDGNVLPYVSGMGDVGATRGVAVARETPFGSSVVVGQVDNPTTISMRWITPSIETDWNVVEPGFVLADANLGGFILNRYSIGPGVYGEDLFGNDCVVTDDPNDVLADIAAENIVDKWCQSFVKRGNVVYVATGDSWQNSFKLLTLRLQTGEQTFVEEEPVCIDVAPVGDGVGWDGTESCIVEGGSIVQSGECVDSPPFGNGFGWDGTASCRLAAGDEAVSVAVSGECFDSPPLNNGFGWDGTASCAITNSYTSREALVSRGADGVVCYEVPPLGTGRGWDGSSSCEVSVENATGRVVLSSEGSCVDVPPLNNGSGHDGTNACTINSGVISALGTCVDSAPIGDGFGWDGTGSCRIVSQVDGQRVCVDVVPLNDGFGWDGVASCRLEGEFVDIDINGCVDTAPFNDGWGWDGMESCAIQY